VSGIMSVMGTSLWTEDDGSFEKQDVNAEYKRIFGERFSGSYAIKMIDGGDTITYLMPGGRYICHTGIRCDEVGTLPPDAALALEWPEAGHCNSVKTKCEKASMYGNGPCKCTCAGCTICRLDPEDAYRLAAARIVLWMRKQFADSGENTLKYASEEIEKIMRRT
jgi:hypothetical protein